ncbi:transposase [Elizabethkingia anophelis]|uniref:transposase n=1 Tax=Elizabethkingia anophelis TaxID=1117645 RepID=UPI00136A4BCE|nr:transposase [Elizabethkingia anophelis]MYY27387.1 transposase [Elizabethkingia anophelis]
MIEKVCNNSKEAAAMLSLTRSFIQMMKTKQGNLLKSWINDAMNSGIKEIFHFARSLLAEYQFIENAINLPWSNGRMEGFVNKLKTIKKTNVWESKH